MKKIILVFLVIVLFFLYGCTDKDTMQPDADYTTEVTYDYEIKKFNEDKRLNTRHGQVEFITSMKYIKEYLKEFNNPKILDVGAGTGKYSINLANDGYDVTALELVKHNLKVIEKNSDKVKVIQGNATDLSKFKDESFDIVLLFGPMYHLMTDEEKIKALSEAKRVTKKNGYILVQYFMNDYCIIRYGFKENNIMNSINNNEIDNNYKIVSWVDNLYSPVRIEDINNYNKILTKILKCDLIN